MISLRDEPPGDLRMVSAQCERLLERRDWLGVCDLLERFSPGQLDPFALWLLVRALAQVSPGRAAVYLERLEDPGIRSTLQADSRFAHRDAREEALGLRARLMKSLWEASPPGESAHQLLHKAFDAYREAFDKTGGYWAGINAATLGLILGPPACNQEWVRSLGAQVREICLEALARPVDEAAPHPDDETYWIYATIGETYLLFSDLDRAREWYARATSGAGATLNRRCSTRQNARRILRTQAYDPDALEPVFQMPRVGLFAGCMIDQPGRARSRFPLELCDAVAAAIRHCLEKYHIGLGYSSAACGSDILFHEELRRVGGSSTIVLPYLRDRFRADSVDFLPEWGDRFDALLESATTDDVVRLKNHPFDFGPLSYEYANRVLLGLAAMRAEELEVDLIPIVVWDGKAGDGPGGTSDVVRQLVSRDRAPVVIDLNRLRSGESPERSLRPLSRAEARLKAPEWAGPQARATIAAILFADVEGFSRLTDSQVPLFVERVLGLMARLVARYQTVTKNTWGDALYVVCEDIADAGCLALELRDAMREEPWRAHGLPAELGVRIGLHAGPGILMTDPVTGLPAFIGAEVSRAARIEPASVKNEVFVSRDFAALAAELGIRRFRTEYACAINLPKGAGFVPLWRLEWGRG